MSGRFVIHSAVDLRLLAWSAAQADDGQDRMVQRKDRYGHPIRLGIDLRAHHDRPSARPWRPPCG